MPKQNRPVPLKGALERKGIRNHQQSPRVFSSLAVLHREQFQVGFLDGQRNHETMKSKGGRPDTFCTLSQLGKYHGKLNVFRPPISLSKHSIWQEPKASDISPHWIVAAKAVAGTLSAVRVKCPSPETPICWVVDHAEVYLDRYQYRSRAKKSWIRRLRITVEQKLSTSVWRPELLAIKWMTDVEIV